MVIVLIRRCVKPDKVEDFLKTYKREKPNHPGFIEEHLTKLRDGEDLPEPMRSLAGHLKCEGCVTYLNVAKWESAETFEQHFKPETTHPPEFECCDRLRLVLDVQDI